MPGWFFKTKGPLDPELDRDFYIERQELEDLLLLCRQPTIYSYGALLSSRQTGKTTLLYHLRRRLRGSLPAVFIDLSVLRNQDGAACYQYVARRLVTQLESRLDKKTLQPLPTLKTSVDFLQFLEKLAESVNTSRIVVMLDEVGALSRESSDSFFNLLRTVFNIARGMDSILAKFFFIFSGAVDLYDLTFGANSPLNICEKIYLGDFSLSDVQRIVGYFEHIGLSPFEGMGEQIYALTSGHVYLTMRLCSLIERQQPEALTLQAVQQAADDLLKGDDNLQHIIRRLDKFPDVQDRLYEIMQRENEIPFSRNDTVLARLEMFGAIRGEGMCQVRNELYRRMLWRYFSANQ
ncbi:MAG: hypothetical protein B6I34_10515 [Anaerolineaceae bacterium 4572_32.1]|nr:MAG: hypothetical protein B6I34_10515 [Anaerolineaceae bacterium 4572_32.1]